MSLFKETIGKSVMAPSHTETPRSVESAVLSSSAFSNATRTVMCAETTDFRKSGVCFCQHARRFSVSACHRTVTELCWWRDGLPAADRDY